MRISYLDAARSVLMSLGVVLHAAAVYDTVLKWKISDASHGEGVVFHFIREFIHAFRMETFFIVSGVFTLMLLKKNGVHFLQLRLPRIAIPLVTTAVTLNTLQAYLLFRFNNEIGDFWCHYFGDSAIDFVLRGQWVSHLWFLINLVIYTVVSYSVYRGWLRYKHLFPPMTHALQKLALPQAIFMIPAIALAPWALAYKLNGFIPPGFALVAIPDLIYYGAFFLLGTAMFSTPAVMAKFTHISATSIVAIPFALVGLYACQALPANALQVLLYQYFRTLLSLALAIAVLDGFRRFASQPSPFFRYLSEASYSIYLFHHVTVMCLGMILVGLPLGVYLKFAIVVFVGFAISVGLHHFVVLRAPLARLLFNGKTGARAATEPATANEKAQ